MKVRKGIGVVRRERGERNTYICDVSVPLEWERESAPRVVLAAGRDPDHVSHEKGNAVFSFSFNTRKERKDAVRRITEALEGPSQYAKFKVYQLKD